MREYCRFDVSLLCPWSEKQRDAGLCICCLLRDIANAISGKGMWPHPLTKEYLEEYYRRLEAAPWKPDCTEALRKVNTSKQGTLLFEKL